MEKNEIKNCIGEYHLFAGQVATKSLKPNEEQAKNSLDGIAYRIPTLLSVLDKNGKETVISATDLSESGSDSGRIQVVTRISEDGGKTFGEMKIALSLPVSKAPQKMWDFKSAFAIDPILVQCRNGDVLMIVDMYPESLGLMKRSYLDKGTGYIIDNGKAFLKLYDGKSKAEKGRGAVGKPYTVRENGFVYTPDGRKTNYYLPKNHSAEYSFETVGDMYYAVGTPDYLNECPPMIPIEEDGRDIYCGNVFLSYGKGSFDEKRPIRVHKKEVSPEKTGEDYSKYTCIETKPAPLFATVKSYLWVLRSTDCGRTWSQPVDISASVMHEDEVFLGTGPGVATCLKHQKSMNGRILVPVYNTKETAVVYSDDNGHVWNRSQCSENIDETQLVEMTDGKVFCFGRPQKLAATPLSVSCDSGETWKKLPRTGLSSIKCQKSVITVPKKLYTASMDKSKDYIIACNPSGTYQQNSKRFGGMVTIGVVDGESITWLKQQKLHADGVEDDNENFFAYSSLTVLANGNVAVMYEGLPGGLLVYEEFTVEWLMNGEEAYKAPENKMQKFFGYFLLRK